MYPITWKTFNVPLLPLQISTGVISRSSANVILGVNKTVNRLKYLINFLIIKSLFKKFRFIIPYFYKNYKKNNSSFPIVYQDLCHKF